MPLLTSNTSSPPTSPSWPELEALSWLLPRSRVRAGARLCCSVVLPCAARAASVFSKCIHFRNLGHLLLFFSVVCWRGRGAVVKAQPFIFKVRTQNPGSWPKIETEERTSPPFPLLAIPQRAAWSQKRRVVVDFSMFTHGHAYGGSRGRPYKAQGIGNLRELAEGP